FFSISGSDFVEMFVGVGASRVRDLFNTAKRSAPAVVFIYEIDAVGRQRGAGLGGGHDEREQTLNQLLVEMDGFAQNQGIIVLAATNRADILDPALLRPGRFDRRITVGYPDIKGREDILKVHARNKKLAPDIDLHTLAQRTPYFTGADLENVLNEAAILATRANRKQIEQQDLEEAITRVQMGPEKKSRVVTAEDNKITAYHESGHAILAIELEHCNSLHEVSIISRGWAAGYTMTLPKEDLHHTLKSHLLDEICMTMGGRVAEKVAFTDVSTGAIQDLKQASEIARKMVEEYGMSDAVGPVFVGGDTEVFIAKDWGHSKNYSEALAAKIDVEMRRILEEQFERAEHIISTNREGLKAVAEMLIQYERVTGEQFEAVYRGANADDVMSGKVTLADIKTDTKEDATDAVGE
ncbi:MAG: AAA family ATPase, partial [Clostridia bacterium]|nr:AAA family ATPase [Clostridia bacterium]